jgi:predicted metal-dependent peptidase
MSTQTIDINALTATVHQRITAMVLRHPFFSTCILNLDVKESPCGTACTDGTVLLWDPEFIAELSREEVSGLLAHEIMHVVLLHPFRIQKGYHDHRLCNIAMDYEINGYLDTYNKEYANSHRGEVPFPLPKGALIDHQYDGMAWEQIYEKLKQQQPPQPPEGEGKGEGEGEGKGKGKGEGKGEGEGQPGGQGPPQPGEFGKVTAPGETGDTSPTNGKSPKTEIEWHSIVAKAESVAKMMGSMPGAFASLLDKLRRPEIPWQEYLSRYFDSHATDDYDTRRPDRRYTPDGIYLPTLYSEQMGEVVIAIDTSGSVYGELFERFMGEVDDVLARLKPVKTTLLQCDTRITDIREYRPGDRVGVDFQLKGGGGTDFRPVFDWIESNNVNPRVLVFFTDGYGSYPPRPPGYDVLWVDYGNYQSYPFGDVIRTKG